MKRVCMYIYPFLILIIKINLGKFKVRKVFASRDYNWDEIGEKLLRESVVK